MLRIQDPSIYKTLSQGIDVGGQPAPVLQLDTTVVPVVLIQPSTTEVPAICGARTTAPGAGNGSMFELIPATVPVSVRALIVGTVAQSVIGAALINGAGSGLPNNQTPMLTNFGEVTSAVYPELVDGTLFTWGSPALAGMTELLSPWRIISSAQGSIRYEFADPVNVLVGQVFQVSCFGDNIGTAVTLEMGLLPDA